MDKIEFSNFYDLGFYIETELAEAELLPAYTRKDGQGGLSTEEVEDYRFVYNTSDDRVSTVVSDRYSLTQHKDFFGTALQTAKQIFPNPQKLIIRDDRERVDLDVISQDHGTAEEVGDDIRYGVRFSNSFDKSIRETVKPYALRLVCTNGMIAPKTLGHQSRYHVGSYDSDDLIQTCQQALESQTTLLPSIIQNAQERIIDPEVEVVLEEDGEEEQVAQHRAMTRMAGFCPSYEQEISEEFGVKLMDGEEPTDWLLYNSATSVIDHQHENLQESTREQKHSQAEKILVGDASNQVDAMATKVVRG